MIGRSGERGSGISVLAARHDDDDFNHKNVRKIELITWNHIMLLIAHTEEKYDKNVQWIEKITLAGSMEFAEGFSKLFLWTIVAWSFIYLYI